jgi:hypothetical protein
MKKIFLGGEPRALSGRALMDFLVKHFTFLGIDFQWWMPIVGGCTCAVRALAVVDRSALIRRGTAVDPVVRRSCLTFFQKMIAQLRRGFFVFAGMEPACGLLCEAAP